MPRQRERNFWLLVWLLGPLACSLSAQATASVESGGRARTEASSVEPEAAGGTFGERPTPPPVLPATGEVGATAVPALDCPWLFGGHLGALGPRSLVTVAAVTQPGVCWLELGLGVGYAAGRYSAGAGGLTAHGHTTSFTIPLRATAWFMERGHSLVADLGLGVTHFRMKATAANVYEGSYTYTRNTTPFLSTLALGYGWRPEGAQPGYRFTALVGGVFYPTTMGRSKSDRDGPFAPGTAAQLDSALDERTDDLTDADLFLEVALGLLF